MNKTFDAVFIANGAGELYAYVRPVIEKLVTSSPEARITIVITPCQYATGKEAEVAEGFPNVSRVITTKEYTRWLFTGKAPKGISFSKEGVIIFMGGDLFHAVFLSKKLKHEIIAYVHSRIAWKKRIKLFMVPDARSAKKFSKSLPPKKLKIVGDLMVDSVKTALGKEETGKLLGLNREDPIILFLPGSRSYLVRGMVPIYIKIGESLRKLNPKIQMIIAVSPFLPKEDLNASVKGLGNIINKNGRNYIKGENFEFLLVDSNIFDAINISDMAVTIPGTNTGEMAALGKPMIVLFPMDKAHILPMEGINNLIIKIPLIAPILRRIIVRLINRRTKYFSLPNIKAGEEIIPEIRSSIDADKTAKIIHEHLEDKEWQIKTGERLKAVMGGAGASDRIAEEILKLAKGS